MDRDAFEASRTWGEAWYSLTDPAGTSIGDAYEVRTGPQQMMPVPMRSGQWAEPPTAFASLETVIRDTRQAHLLSAVRLGSDPFVTVCGPDRTPLGTISHTGDASQSAVHVTLGSAPAYRIALPDRRERSPGAPRFSIQRADGAEVGSLTLRRVADSSSAGPTPASRRGLRLALAITMAESSPPPASGLVGALPMGLAMLLAPALGMDPAAYLPNLSGLGRRALGGLAGALLEGLADTDWS